VDSNCVCSLGYYLEIDKCQSKHSFNNQSARINALIAKISTVASIVNRILTETLLRIVFAVKHSKKMREGNA
jgi:hypothetical protein